MDSSGNTTRASNTKGGFNYADGYDDLSDAEIEALLREARLAVTSLEGKLMKRHPENEFGHRRMSKDVVRRFIKPRRCSPSAVFWMTHWRTDAFAILTTSQTVQARKTLQTFLGDVLRHCGPSLALLCAASFGSKRLTNLGSSSRVSLLAYVKATQSSLDSTALQRLAKEYHMPSSSSGYGLS
ncbi:MAG: hypothetical protein M4579_006478 [Chaenotheca gracillima]|nr:MAG: hypothetical protein M4579_006478 [Chaenotheca gracillima]